VSTDCGDAREARQSARAIQSPVHRSVASENRNQDRRIIRQTAHRSGDVTTQLVRHDRIAMCRVHLEIADVPSGPRTTVQVTFTLAERDASHHFSIALGNSDAPAVPLEPVEREKIRTPVDPKLYVAGHRAGGGERYKTLIVTWVGVAHAEWLHRTPLFAEKSDSHALSLHPADGDA